MATTSVPQMSFGVAGFVAPAESSILPGVQADMNGAFGGNLNQALTTPQGQLASSQSAIIGDNYDQQIALFNSVDPAYAAGRMQDAIGRIYYIERKPATPTTVTATCVGDAQTPIPAGSLARDTSGNIYASTGDAVIPGGGSIDIEFQCTTTGPISCPAGTLTRIYRVIPGWDTVSNAADGVLGGNVESRADFEARRSASVAVNAKGSAASIKASVLGINNVLDAYVIDNANNTPQTVGGITLAANSVYICVLGGPDADIAAAIWAKKSLGCSYTGSTSVSVQDTVSYSYPYPTYTVTFQRPASTPLYLAVQLANNGNVPNNYATLVQAAIVSAFAGGDGGARARIGSTVFASRFYASLAALGSWAQVVSVYIGRAAAPTGLSVTMDIDEAPTTSAAEIAVSLV